MSDLAMLANNPYLPGNPAFERTPEQKRASMYSAIAHTLIGLGSGISRAGMGGQPWMAGFEQGAHAVSADRDRMFQQSPLPTSGASPSANPQPSQPTQIEPPKPGFEKNGYRFKGGNPADKNNWEKVQ